MYQQIVLFHITGIFRLHELGWRNDGQNSQVAHQIWISIVTR